LSAEPGIFTLPCSDCGAALEIARDMDTFICDFCGSRQIVQRGGRLLSLKSRAGDIEAGSGQTASSLAIERLTGKQLALAERVDALKTARDIHASRAAVFIAGCHFLLAATACGILAGISIEYDRPFSTPLGLLLFGISAGWGMWRARRRQNSIEKQFDPDIDALEERLDSIEDQLERHRRIVASPPPNSYSNPRKPKSRQPQYR
jgi:hypothetical protein